MLIDYKAKMTHWTPSRCRIRFLNRDLDPAFFKKALRQVNKLEGIYAASFNDQTKSLLIEHDLEKMEIVDSLRTESICEVVWIPDDILAEAPDEKIRNLIIRAEKNIKRSTGDTLNFRSIIGIGLLGLSVYQFSKGRTLAPASSLLSDGLSLMLKG